VDVAAATRIRSGYVELLASLQADVLFCNAVEADVLGITAELPDWAPELVLVHDGPRPTRVRTREGAWEVPVEPVEVRDTTGCGDAFAAGVLAGWRAGSPLLDSVRDGHAAAAAVAQVIGAQPPS
jgi:sugar/nucleoside kinase (ribokinase family)